MHFNWVDIVILIALGLGAWHGLRRGFVGLAFELVGLIVAFLASLAFAPRLATFFAHSFRMNVAWTQPLGFVVAFFLSLIIVNFFLDIVQRLFAPIIRANPFNRLLGLAAGAAWQLIYVGIFLAVIVSIPLLSSLRASIDQSVLAPPILHATLAIDQSLENRLGGSSLSSLALQIASPDATTTTALNFTDQKPTVDQAAESQMLTLTNAIRLSQGLSPLKENDGLRAAARAHAKDMLAKGYFSHLEGTDNNPSTRISQAGVPALAVGENLALAPSVDIAEAGLLASPPHRANILNKQYNAVGIGVLNAGSYGKIIVEDFAETY